MIKYIRYSTQFILILILFANCIPDKIPENDCKCDLLINPTTASGNTKNEIHNGGNIKGKPEVSAKIKKLVDVSLKIEGGYSNKNTSIEKTFWEVVEGNPSIAQNTNLFRNITCALVENACNNPLFSPQELFEIKQQYYKEYYEKVEDVLELQKKRNQKDSSDKEKNKNRSPVIPNSIPESHSSPSKQKNYLTSKAKVQIAIIPIGDRSHYDLSISVIDWLKGAGWKANNNFFKTSFWSTYQRNLKNNELEPFSVNRISSFTNCVCLFDQSVKLEESTLAGQSYVKANLDAKLKVFNLNSGQVNNEWIKINGAGGTIGRAMESLSEKLEYKLGDLQSIFKLCK